MHLIWHSRRGRRRNHLWQIFWWSVEGCRFCGGSKIALSHWLSQWPLTQGWRYRAACDMHGPLLYHFASAWITYKPCVLMHNIQAGQTPRVVVVCNAAGGRAGRPPGEWAVGRLTLHGGPVVLRPVRATSCFISQHLLYFILHTWGRLNVSISDLK